MRPIPFVDIAEGKPHYQWADVELDAFPSVVEREWFGDLRPDEGAFGEALLRRLGAALEVGVVAASCYWRRGAACQIFAYTDETTVIPLRCNATDHLFDWICRMSASFGETDGGMQFIVQNNGMSSGRIMPSALEALDSDPTPLVLKHAPKKWSRRDPRKRAEKLASFAFGDVSPRTEIWDEAAFDAALTAVIESHGAGVAGATDVDWREVDGVSGAVPQSLQALYRRVDGATELFAGFDLYSHAQAMQQWEMWRAIFEEWSVEELREFKSADPEVHPVYCCDRWFPIIDLVGGHHIMIDMAPTPAGCFGQVILAGRDITHNRLLAKSLAEFLTMCADYDASESHALWNVFGALRL